MPGLNIVQFSHGCQGIAEASSRLWVNLKSEAIDVKDISLLYLVHAQEFKQEITKGHTCLSNFDCGAVYRATHT